MRDSMSRGAGRLRSPGEGLDRRGPRHQKIQEDVTHGARTTFRPCRHHRRGPRHGDDVVRRAGPLGRALSLVTSIFREGAERNRALSVWGAVAGSAGAAGVLLGGVLTSGLGWRSVLFVNVPIGIAAILLTPTLVADSRGETARRGFDLPGAATVTAGLSAPVYALVRASTVGWGSVQTIGVLAAAAVLLVAFVAIERRSRSPLVPFAFFRNLNVSAANATMLAVGAAALALFYFLSIYMQRVLGYSAITTGLAQLPIGAGVVVAAGMASPLVARLGRRKVLIGGLAMFAAGLVWSAQVSVHAGSSPTCSARRC